MVGDNRKNNGIVHGGLHALHAIFRHGSLFSALRCDRRRRWFCSFARSLTFCHNDGLSEIRGRQDPLRFRYHSEHLQAEQLLDVPKGKHLVAFCPDRVYEKEWHGWVGKCGVLCEWVTAVTTTPSPS